MQCFGARTPLAEATVIAFNSDECTRVLELIKLIPQEGNV